MISRYREKREIWKKLLLLFFLSVSAAGFIFSLLLGLPGNSSGEDLSAEETALGSLNDLLVH